MSTVTLESNTTRQGTGKLNVSATQRVYKSLRRDIIEGKILPGEKLKIETLKLKLDSGSSPIREALSLLTSDQLVERIDQRGFRAASASIEHFQEILTLRCQLEDIALRESVIKGTAEWQEALILQHHRMTQVKKEDTEQFEIRHKAFHQALIDACQSSILLKFCDQLYDLNIRYRFLAGLSAQYGERHVAKEHKDILDAVLQRDENLASKNLRQHYEKTGEFLKGQLNSSLEF